jgi:YYY domain-containing protein
VAELFEVIIWWLMIQFIGWLALPIAFHVFRWLPDRGYSFAKSIGLLLTGYIIWLGASTQLLRNDLGGVYGSLLVVAAISVGVTLARRRSDLGSGDSIKDFLRSHLGLIFSIETLFTLALLLWVILRAYDPDKVMNAGGEKFMEMAFLNGILNSPSFPPLDPWLSGFGISYYYFGYVMMAALTRLSGAAAGVAFNIYAALLFALTTIGVFGVVYNLVAGSRQARDAPRSNQAIQFGLFGALLVVLMGNLEGLLESVYARGLLPESFWRWINIPGLLGVPVSGSWVPGSGFGWWWWRGSRVIQDFDLGGNPINASPITEFPFFSFLLGDNHPHVLALPFVLLCIALSLNLLRMLAERPAESTAAARQAVWWNPIQRVFGGRWDLFGFYALSLGSLGFLNTWDMPIYLGLVVLAYGAGVFIKARRLDWDLLLACLALGIGLGIAAAGLYLLFYLSFSSQAGGILPYVFPPTRLPQYLVIFGPFVFILLWYLLVFLAKSARRQPRMSFWKSLVGSWLKVALACLILFVLIFTAILASDTASQLAQNELSDSAILAALGGRSLSEAIQVILMDRLSDPWLFLLLTLLIGLTLANLLQYRQNEADHPQVETSPADVQAIFSLLMILAGLALTFSTEFAYLRDSFGVRMNTVFKFYYQGWILLGLGSAYGVWWLLHEGRPVLGRVGSLLFLSGTLLLLAAGLVYPVMAYYSRAAGFRSEANLDGTATLRRNNPDDFAAIDWLRNQLALDQIASPQDVPVILEAPTKPFASYVYEGRISAFTGFPTILGWYGHEGQWRGSYVEQSVREPDIASIYTTGDPQLALDLLHKWNVRYLIFSPIEQRYIQDLCSSGTRACNLTRATRKFETSLTPVFQQGGLTIYAVQVR